ncbi:MAG: Rrf2 family transcriptional regulator [Gammaproteobacteria bacterium]|nr:Rrf2 family transcriptional regulator [Gammaproteobacteria bacterium]
MQLTHYTDYSLRVLIFLSLQDDEQRITITDIAEHFSIPRNHLVKVVHKLGVLKYIHTTRGKNGGIRIAKPASQIVIGSVVRQMEANLDIVNCQMPSPCPIQSGCKLKSILNLATQAFLDVLDQYTIADLNQKPEQLKQLLQWNIVHS